MLEDEVHLLCEGGFPKLDVIQRDYINQFVDIEMHYVQRYMCIEDLCPCSEKINTTSFGIRQIELNELDMKSGRAFKFYDHCYLDLTNSTAGESKTTDLEPKP